MYQKSFYDIRTGIIKNMQEGLGKESEIDFPQEYWDGEWDMIDGIFNPMTQMVDTASGEIIPRPAEQAILTYKDKRQREYPAIEDQLDAIWKGGQDMETMRAAIMATKEKYPKE